MGRLAGYRTIVTGAGSGIGRACVQRYLKEGARVIGIVRNADDAAELIADGAEVLIGDVTDYATAERAIERANSLWGGLDVFVANAGIWDFHKRIEKQSPDELRAAFNEMFATNVLGAVFAAKASITALRKSGGSIVVTGSNASFMGGGGGALYTASKFALRGLVKQLALEFAPEVRVNGVAPGATNTAISGPSALGQQSRHMNGDKGRMEIMASHMPLGRVSAPEDHASLFVLLASREESAYVTGAMYLSDGGLTLSV